MRRHSSPYYSPPRRGYGGRGRSPPRRGYGGYGGRKENNGSLLVRNIPLSSRPEDLRAPFERFGPVRDVYLPKDYYTGEPRGFAFIQFVDPCDASEAQYHMNRKLFGGREITVVLAAETRKRPEEMRGRSRVGGPSGYDDRRSHYGRHRSRSRSRSRSISRSRSPRYSRQLSRSYSPAPRRRSDHSASPRREKSGRTRSPRDHPPGRGEGGSHRSGSPSYSDANRKEAENGHKGKSPYDDDKGSPSRWRSSRRTSGSPPGSRSRSADPSPRHSR